jgi:hypothetical protein
MKNVISMLLVQIGGLLVLSGPVMAYLEIGLWGVPMMWGIAILLMAVVNHNLDYRQ